MTTNDESAFAALNDSVKGIQAATAQLDRDAPTDSQLDAIVERGTFRPTEDEAIGFWFARFLSMRESLLIIIEDVRAIIENSRRLTDPAHELRYFLFGYAAVCLLIRIDRIMLFRVARHSIIQRKLNESFPEFRIPRKQYTKIFSAFVATRNVLAIRDAMQFSRKNRRKLLRLRNDEHVGFIARQLQELEASLNANKLSYLKRAWSYVSHKWRRRGIVSVTNLFFGIMEAVGRTTSEFYDAHNKMVAEATIISLENFLQPGDVIITRHAKALTNLFLPGFWPHAALYIGTPEQRNAAGIVIDEIKASLWVDDICVLEARKDGVRFRPLRETLAVDVFVVLRPALNTESIKKAVERAISHEGKQYNFDFDFFNSDRIVCTELIYRAYDGIEDISIPLQERGGRKTLSAEDLLDFALEADMFAPVAIFGVADCKDEVAYGDRVRNILVASYRYTSASDSPN